MEVIHEQPCRWCVPFCTGCSLPACGSALSTLPVRCCFSRRLRSAQAAAYLLVGQHSVPCLFAAVILGRPKAAEKEPAAPAKVSAADRAKQQQAERLAAQKAAAEKAAADRAAALKAAAEKAAAQKAAAEKAAAERRAAAEKAAAERKAAADKAAAERKAALERSRSATVRGTGTVTVAPKSGTSFARASSAPPPLRRGASVSTDDDEEEKKPQGGFFAALFGGAK